MSVFNYDGSVQYGFLSLRECCFSNNTANAKLSGCSSSHIRQSVCLGDHMECINCKDDLPFVLEDVWGSGNELACGDDELKAYPCRLPNSDRDEFVIAIRISDKSKILPRKAMIFVVCPHNKTILSKKMCEIVERVGVSQITLKTTHEMPEVLFIPVYYDNDGHWGSAKTKIYLLCC